MNSVLRTENKTLTKYVWQIKDETHKFTIIKWNTVKNVQSLKRGNHSCRFCRDNTKHKLLNKRCELISKCRHINKFLMCHLPFDSFYIYSIYLYIYSM